MRDVVISPGSRNTPLTIAFAEHPDVFVYSHMDERSAAFFALGLARGSGRPVVISCTSGTASANYYPAVMEAFLARVPLIVVTADRPPQLRDVGANQAARQMGEYASHVKWSIELPIPDGQRQTATHAASVAARACATAAVAPAGPVHINYPFIEPLMPQSRSDATQRDEVKVPVVHLSRSVLDTATIAMLDATFRAAKRPLIVIGPDYDMDQLEAVLAFAVANQVLLMIDALGQLRNRSSLQLDIILSHYDTLLKVDIDSLSLQRPDWILRFGAQPTSKALSAFLADLPSDTRTIVVDESPLYRDASFCATDVVVGDVGEWLTATSRSPSLEQDIYRREWLRVNQVVGNIVAQQVIGEWSEASLIHHLTRWLDEGTQLMIGNSRPVRDLDTVLAVTDHEFCVFANRGASGIDGVVSTAFGLAAAHPKKHTVLCIGDVSFYHDVNGLLAARRFDIPLTIILVHNHGGGIFQHLSQAQRPDMLSYFTTPHEIDFQPIVQAYGGLYLRVDDEATCHAAFLKARESQSLHVIEVMFENATGSAWHRRLVQAVHEGLEREL